MDFKKFIDVEKIKKLKNVGNLEEKHDKELTKILFSYKSQLMYIYLDCTLNDDIDRVNPSRPTKEAYEAIKTLKEYVPDIMLEDVEEYLEGALFTRTELISKIDSNLIEELEKLNYKKDYIKRNFISKIKKDPDFKYFITK